MNPDIWIPILILVVGAAAIMVLLDQEQQPPPIPIPPFDKPKDKPKVTITTIKEITEQILSDKYSIIHNSITKKYYPKVNGKYFSETNFIDIDYPLTTEKVGAKSYSTKKEAFAALLEYRAYIENYKDTEEEIKLD